MAARTWEGRTRRLQGAVNSVAWLELAAPWLFGAAALVALVLYAVRRSDSSGLAGSLVGGLMGGLALAVAAGTGWQMRRRWFSRSDARTLLDVVLGLECRLTAAAAGVSGWPDPARGAGRRVLRWRPWPSLGWLGGAAALVWAGQHAPLPAGESRIADTAQTPALAEIAAVLAEARALDVAQPEALDALEKRAEELGVRPAAERFSHAGLEAADALRGQVTDQLAGLGHALETIARSLEQLAADGGLALTPGQQAAAAAALEAALHELRAGALPMATELAAALPAGAGQAAKLSPEQAEALARQLGAAGKALRGIAGAATGRVPIAGERGEGEWAFSWLPEQPGMGGVDRGPGAAPLALAPVGSEALAGELAGMQGSPHATPALGELVRVSREAPSPESGATPATAPVTAGAIAAPARGGEAVWVDRLSPEERAAVRAFFH